MIRITQVKREIGYVTLQVEYTDAEGKTEALWIREEDVIEKFWAFRSLMGRMPNDSELKEILVKMVDDQRRKPSLLPEIPWENYVGVNLE